MPMLVRVSKGWAELFRRLISVVSMRVGLSRPRLWLMVSDRVLVSVRRKWEASPLTCTGVVF